MTQNSDFVHDPHGAQTQACINRYKMLYKNHPKIHFIVSQQVATAKFTTGMDACVPNCSRPTWPAGGRFREV